MTKAYSYIRFSTPEQSKGSSLERQVKRAEQYAAANGLELDQTLSFRDLGVSAFSKANISKGGKLGEFLAAVDSGLVPPGSHLLVESLDRLTRASIGDALDLFLSILRRKIVIHSLMDNSVFSQADLDGINGFQKMVVSLAVLSRANEESKTKSDRLKGAWTIKRLKADGKKMTSLAPAWLMYEPAPGERDASEKKGTGKFKLVAEHVAVVRRIVSMVFSGLGAALICKRLNEDGVPTFTVRSGDRGWYPSYIKKILRNRSLIGEFQPHREEVRGKRVPDGPPIADYFPAVMSAADFAELQAVLNGRGRTSGGRRGEGFSNLFTGLLRCGYCQSPVIHIGKGFNKRDRSKPLRYLVCSRAKRGAGCCYVSWRYEEFEASFLKHARSVDFRTIVGGKPSVGGLQAQRAQLNSLRASLSDIDLQLERLVDAIASGSGQPQMIVDRIAQREAEKATLLERIAVTEAQLGNDELREATTNPMLDRLAALQRELSKARGTQLFDLRAEVNESLRRQLAVINVYPGGVLASNETIAAFRYHPEIQGCYKNNEVEDVVRRVTLPESKQFRYLQIVPVRGNAQWLFPDHPIPDAVDAIRARSSKDEVRT